MIFASGRRSTLVVHPYSQHRPAEREDTVAYVFASRRITEFNDDAAYLVTKDPNGFLRPYRLSTSTALGTAEGTNTGSRTVSLGIVQSAQKRTSVDTRWRSWKSNPPAHSKSDTDTVNHVSPRCRRRWDGQLKTTLTPFPVHCTTGGGVGGSTSERQ